MNRSILAALLLTLLGCGSGEIKPVDIFPEDGCSLCRMAFSDHRFAVEMISDQNEVFKFDDIGCMMTFKKEYDDIRIAATFLMDYDTRKWIPYERAVIVETNVSTPMGSGKVAFRDATRAREFQQQNPPSGKSMHGGTREQE